jgi:hypothetical protein
MRFTIQDRRDGTVACRKEIAMAEKRAGSNRNKKTQSKPSKAAGGKSGKVGSNPEADREFGGKLDFGLPASKVTAPLPDGGREKGPEQGTGPMRSGEGGVRVAGVGHAPGKPGTGSGGDLDPDFVGLDGKGGLAATPPSGRTRGEDITEGGSGAFASGPPARGENELPAGTHGAPSEIVHGSTVDRTGGDASTTGSGGGADSASGASGSQRRSQDAQDDAAAGEISSGEASGNGG